MSFLNPLFFFGVVALAAPVLIHLVRRTRARRVMFPSLMLVQSISHHTARHRRLHNLLLLALRCLLLLLLIISFTRPYFSGSNKGMGKQHGATVILLDTSLSMQIGNHFDQAQTQARTLIDQAPDSDELALVGFDQSYHVLNRWTSVKAQLQEQLGGVRPGLGGTDYEQALRGAQDLFTEVIADEKKIVLISDFQATGWTARTSFRLQPDIKLQTVNVGTNMVPNLAVIEVSAQPVSYQQKYHDKLVARIANYGDEAQRDVKVELQINGKTVEARQMAIPARNSEVVEFSGFDLLAGENMCAITASGHDEFALDNRFYLTLERKPQWKVLIIENAARAGSESLFLRDALTTGDNLPFTLTVKTAGSINPNELSSYRLVVINDAAGVGQALASNLSKFIEQGGRLIIAAGRHTDPRAFNRDLGLLSPVELGDTVQLRDRPVMMAVKTDHPIFEIFRQSGRLSAVHIFAYHRSNLHNNALVLARFDDGSPALVESSLGQGKVLMWTTTFDVGWTDLPLTPFFLPLIRQMVHYLGEPDARAWHLVNDTFTAHVTSDGIPPAVDTPRGERLTERRTFTSVGDLIILAREPGFYRLRYPDHTEFAGVNIDSKESDLARLEMDEFIAAVTDDSSEKTSSPLTKATTSSLTSKAGEQDIEARRSIWWWLLIVVVLMLAAEAMLARRTRNWKITN